MAYKKQLKILKQKIKDWNKWKEDNPKGRPQKQNLLFKIIIFIFVPIFSAIIPSIISYFLRPPQFIIINSFLGHNEKLIIQARNYQANQKKHLDVMFDGASCPNSGVLDNVSTQSEYYQWHFDIKEQIKKKQIDAEKLTKNEYKIKVCFPGDKYSDEFKISFKTQQQIHTNINFYINFFHQEGEKQEIKIDKNSGFEFDIKMNSIPLLKNDSDFWKLEIEIEQTNYSAFIEQHYSAFMSSKIFSFGSDDFVKVKVEKKIEKLEGHLKIRIAPQNNIKIEFINITIIPAENSLFNEWKYKINSISPLILTYDKKRI